MEVFRNKMASFIVNIIQRIKTPEKRKQIIRSENEMVRLKYRRKKSLNLRFTRFSYFNTKVSIKQND